jgi:hypothetical protein
MKPSEREMLIAERDALRQSQAVMASFLVTLLKEKHEGKAFISCETLAKVQSMPYSVTPVYHKDLQNVALSVVEPEAQPLIERPKIVLAHG